MHIYRDMTDKSSVDFLHSLKLASPIQIARILSDNGSQFTDRFANKDKKHSGEHAFDVSCAALPAEHRLAPPRHPQTNGMVERFNGRINELLQQTRFDSRADLQATLMNYLKLYNHHITQRAIEQKRPSWRSRNGGRSGQNYSLNAFMVKRDSTPSKPICSLWRRQNPAPAAA